MTSIMTNPAAMAALQTLRAINHNLETTQGRISSGFRVETAADNAAYWSIATTMRSDNAALSTVHDALGLGAAKVDTFYSAMDTVIDVMTEIKAKLVAASEPGVDKDKINKEVAELKSQLNSAAQSAPSPARTGSITVLLQHWAPNRSSPPSTAAPTAALRCRRSITTPPSPF
jgi:flagellin